MAEAKPFTTLPARLIILIIQGYRFFLSPWLGNQCRFHPTCSHYAEDAVTTYGALRGSLLTLRRLGRCHPWQPGGYDPIPCPPTATDD